MKKWQPVLALISLVLAGACADAGSLVSVEGVKPGLTLTAVSVVCPDTIMVGQTAQCIHYAYDQNNNFISGTTATWSTSTPSLISVSSSGSITGLAVGNASVQATSGGVTGSRGVYVKPGLSISLADGPGLVQRYDTCTWRAGVSGGTGPYTYAWTATSASGSAYTYEWTGYTISSLGFTLKVTVTDANGVKGSQTRYITTSTSAPLC
jgi:Bacterial Ig-like domain (group 2)